MIHSEMGRVCFEAYFSFFKHNKRLEAQDRFDVFFLIEVEVTGNPLLLALCELLFSSHRACGVHPLLTGSGQGSGSLRHKTTTTDIHIARYSQGSLFIPISHLVPWQACKEAVCVSVSQLRILKAKELM